MKQVSIRKQFIRRARAAITEHVLPFLQGAVQADGYAYDDKGNIYEVHLFTWVVALIRWDKMPRETVLVPALASLDGSQCVILGFPTDSGRVTDVSKQILDDPRVLRALIFPRGTKATLEATEGLPSLKGWNRLRWRFELPAWRSCVTPQGLRIEGRISAFGLRPMGRR